MAPIGWLVLVGIAFVTPALFHGSALGPYDVLNLFGLTQHAHPVVHNLVNSDEIEEFIPWQAMSWMQVHHGHLPLWNPNDLLGLPLAFNVQSDPFSLSVAIGYLFPLSLSHSATVVARLVLGGSGMYVFARTLRLQQLPAVFAATIYELSGGLTIWLGAYEADAMAWAGWVFAASVLVLRGRHRVAATSMLAIALAGSFLAGEPQIAAVLVAALVLFAVVVVMARARTDKSASAGSGLFDHGIALVGGAALAAPVYLPGIQLGLHSARAAGPPASNLPLYDLSHLVFSSYNGLPTDLSTVIGPDNLYVSMLYVGVIALVVASLSLWRARRAEVLAVIVVLAVALVAVFFSPIVRLLHVFPYLKVFRLQLATTMIDFCLATLAGVGAQMLFVALRTRRLSRSMLQWWLVVTAVLAGAVTVLGVMNALNVHHLERSQQAMRAGSFFWPAVGLLGCVALAGICWRYRLRDARPWEAHRSRRFAQGLGAGLLLVETGFLLSAGAGLVSSSPSDLPTNPGIVALQRVVGTSLVGFGTCQENAFPATGIVPNANGDYGLAEFAAYDPIVPATYYQSYGTLTGASSQVFLPVGLICPPITSLGVARHYGIGYVIEPHGTAGPPGTTFVGTYDQEDLYRVPDSGRVTLVDRSGPPRPVVERVTSPSPGTLVIHVDASHASTLQLRVTNVPGWHATLAGRALALTSFDQVMLAAKVPAGHYTVTLHYWPLAFSIGLWIAGAALFVLIGAPMVVARRRRRNTATSSSH